MSFPAGADSAIISVIAAKALPSTSRGVIVAQYTVAVQEIHEQCGGTTFIAVGERVILDNLIQQVRGFLLGGTVQFFASERLVESCDDSLERTVAFPPEQIGLRVERHRPDELQGQVKGEVRQHLHQWKLGPMLVTARFVRIAEHERIKRRYLEITKSEEMGGLKTRIRARALGRLA